jgi:hypothetical protein
MFPFHKKTVCTIDKAVAPLCGFHESGLGLFEAPVGGKEEACFLVEPEVIVSSPAASHGLDRQLMRQVQPLCPPGRKKKKRKRKKKNEEKKETGSGSHLGR